MDREEDGRRRFWVSFDGVSRALQLLGVVVSLMLAFQAFLYGRDAAQSTFLWNQQFAGAVELLNAAYDVNSSFLALSRDEAHVPAPRTVLAAVASRTTAGAGERLLLIEKPLLEFRKVFRKKGLFLPEAVFSAGEAFFQFWADAPRTDMERLRNDGALRQQAQARLSALEHAIIQEFSVEPTRLERMERVFENGSDED